jgi:hypothetical protein
LLEAVAAGMMHLLLVVLAELEAAALVATQKWLVLQILAVEEAAVIAVQLEQQVALAS